MSSQTRQYTMSKDALEQRRKYGFKKDQRYSGEWTMVRMRTDIRNSLKSKFGSLTKAYEFALKAQ